MFQAGLINGEARELIAQERYILASSLANDSKGIEDAEVAYASHERAMRDAIATLLSKGVSPQGRPVVDAAVQSMDKAAPIYAGFLDLIHKHRLKEAKQLSDGELDAALRSIAGAGTRMLLRQQEVTGKAAQSAAEDVVQSRWLVSVLLLFGAGVSVIAWLIVHGLDRQLSEIAFELSESAHQVLSASSQVSSSSQCLASDTSEQAAMIEETSASSEEINSMARRNTESAEQATLLVAEAVVNSAEANRAVNECVQAMDALGASSAQIARIIEVIDKIAFQTNILALNAAVEAARAGEAGAGFAVVAEEVRNLAQRCAKAAQETSGLITQSVENTAAGREKMNLLVESGQKVNDTFARVKVVIDEIGLSSQEQGKGIDQISRSIGRMEQGTQKNAANAEEGAAAAEQLNAQSDALRGSAARLGRMVGIVADTEDQAKQTLRRPAATVPAKLSEKRPLTARRPAPGQTRTLEPNFAAF